MIHWLVIWFAFGPHDALVEWIPERPDVPDVYVTIPAPETELELQTIHLRVIDALTDEGHRIKSARVLAPNPEGHWVPLPALLPAMEPTPQRETEMWAMKGGEPGSPVVRGVESAGHVPGSLAGKTVYLSQAHGFTWTPPLARWATQRANTHGIVEDLVNAEGINHYLIPYLLNAGATVFPVREPDRNPTMVVVDVTEATLEGNWQSGPPGWKVGTTTLEGAMNPFSSGETRVASTSEVESATATFTASLPSDGTYGVHVAWSAGPDRAPNARITVRHAGGDALFHVDQRRHGSTWVYLGRFRFRADNAAVIVSNESLALDATVSADAVRFGGGMGLVKRGTGEPPAAGPTSGRPRWEECSRYHSQFQGAPSSVFDNSSKDDRSDDVGNRSRYSAWQHEMGEDAVFVSWHSNAPSPGRGTSTWVYGPNEPNGQYIFTGIEGSDSLAQAVHQEVIQDIQAYWDPNWKDRGIMSAWFGELNPKSNPEMPAALIEVAYHDTEEDAKYLAEPRFRRAVSRAIAHGIVRYFAERDGQEPHFAPEPPQHLMVFGNPDGSVTAQWDPAEWGHDSTEYRVWTSTDGFGFSLTAVVSETEVTLTDITVGHPLAIRVTATNAGGESFPTSSLSVMPSCDARSERALIVQGFTRLDRFGLPVEDLSHFGLGHVLRLDQDRINTFDYALLHGEAMASAGIAYDAAEATAVETDRVDLLGYAMVDWILGEESTVDETFNAIEQVAIAQYLEEGGRLLATGAEIGWDLDNKGTDDDRAFANNYLKIALANDDAETVQLASGITFTHAFEVDFPDSFVPQQGAQPLWMYDTGQVAAVSWLGSFGVVTAGFPLEAVAGADARATLMSEALEALNITPTLDQCTPNSGDTGGDTGARLAEGSYGTVEQRGGEVRSSNGSCAQTPRSTPSTIVVFILALIALMIGRPRQAEPVPSRRSSAGA